MSCHEMIRNDFLFLIRLSATPEIESDENWQILWLRKIMSDGEKRGGGEKKSVHVQVCVCMRVNVCVNLCVYLSLLNSVLIALYDPRSKWPMHKRIFNRAWMSRWREPCHSSTASNPARCVCTYICVHAWVHVCADVCGCIFYPCTVCKHDVCYLKCVCTRAKETHWVNN